MCETEGVSIVWMPLLFTGMEVRNLSRIVNAPIDVTLGPDGTGRLRPVSFIYRGERHQVTDVLDVWKMFDRPWWDDPQAVGGAAAEVTYWRIQTSRGGVFEIVQDGQRWKMYKIYD
jgi:hypothetical protein